MILLQNEFIKATFIHKGAELKSLVSQETKLEYMWSADPDYWAKTSPVLFPIVGALKEDSYTYQEKEYALSRHGFARDMNFSLQQISDEEILFSLEDSQETLLHYPFSFQLGIRYKLAGASLTCTYEVLNKGTAPMLFSIGAHPAFAVPLTKEHQYADYYLLFNKDSELRTHQIEGNLIGTHTAVIELQEGKLVLAHDLFKKDALVVKELKSDRISLLNTKDDHGLHFDFQDFPYFGIWAANEADFVCLEPWCGIADSVNHNGKLEDKEGIVSLMPQTQWKRNWKISIS
ncbi:aldose 1-epimerase family protein [Pedobacter sp.]|uniref:aldose 1-epimerase family protein n=1 Tax=Pedobacter sp. TaxID=1411316 RepID=UPI003D7F9CDB